MIRPGLLKKVLSALQAHRSLSQDDFNVHEVEKSGGPSISIDYRYDNALFFRFIIPTERTKTRDDSSAVYRFKVTVRPGGEAVEESFNAAGRDELMRELREWVGRLYEDVVSVPVARQFQEHERAIHKLAARLNVLPDEPISRTDTEAFNEGLEKLRAEILKHLKEDTADKNA